MAYRSCCFVLLLLIAGNSAGASQKEKKPAIYTIPLPPKPDFSALDWIIGEWAGHTAPMDGKQGVGTLHLTVSYALDRRFIAVTEEVSLPAGDLSSAVREAWYGFISPSATGRGFTLLAFSSTGFITQYHVSATSTEVRFDPEGGANPPPGWLFRRVISRLAPEYFEEKVDVAPPGGSFFSYYTGKLTAVLKPASTPPGSESPVKP